MNYNSWAHGICHVQTFPAVLGKAHLMGALGIAHTWILFVMMYKLYVCFVTFHRLKEMNYYETGCNPFPVCQTYSLYKLVSVYRVHHRMMTMTGTYPWRLRYTSESY